MNDDTRGLIYGTIALFLLGLVAWLSFVYISACSFTLSCIQGAPLVVRTPVPTLIPLGEVKQQPVTAEVDFKKCQVGAIELIGAWVEAEHSDTEAFPFTDRNGQNCEATYEDIQLLLRENSIWFPGSLGCISCHNADLTERSAGLDLSTYEALSQGSRRVPEMTSPGTDIFGGGEWEESLLHEFLVNQGLTPQGHSPDVEPSNPILYVGQVVAGEGEVTVTPTP
ncbi:MAG TPA: hypothetical protein VFG81_04200 [Anaerolineales bacterium]|jgi:hypothetical protein|nr:hypothetical protein [Anaerolineales bacterium]